MKTHNALRIETDCRETLRERALMSGDCGGHKSLDEEILRCWSWMEDAENCKTIKHLLCVRKNADLQGLEWIG